MVVGGSQLAVGILDFCIFASMIWQILFLEFLLWINLAAFGAQNGSLDVFSRTIGRPRPPLGHPSDLVLQPLYLFLLVQNDLILLLLDREQRFNI